MPPSVRSFHHPPTGTWTHVVLDPASRHAAIIDPVLDFDPASGRITSDSARRVVEYIEATGLHIDWILETHAHADHLTAAYWLKAELGRRGNTPGIGIGRGIIEVQRTFAQRLNLGPEFTADGSQFDVLLDDGDRLRIGEMEGMAIATPGHTPDSLSYVFGDAAFIGDTLFAPSAGTARCDFPGGDAAILFASIQRLYALPGATRLFLAHDYPAEGAQARVEVSVDEQKRSNIHVRSDTRAAEFVALRQQRDATLAAPRLLWPSLQVNIRAGRLPPPEANGQRYLRIPLVADFDS